MQMLKQSTTATIKLGPFLDASDGVTEETGLTPAIEVSKNGGAFAARNSATAVAHDAEGWYDVELDATDTGTLGPLTVKAHDSATHLPVYRHFMVVPAHVYDGLVPGTDFLQVDAQQVGGATPDTAADAADAVWDEARSGHTSAGSFGEGVASVQGNVTGSVNSVTTKTGFKLASDGLDQITTTEPAGVPVWGTATVVEAVDWIMALHRNKRTTTSTTDTLRDDGDASDIATASVSDDGTTFTRGEWS